MAIEHKIKKLYPELSMKEAKLVGKKVEKHIRGGNKVGQGFLDNVVKGVKNLGSKIKQKGKALLAGTVEVIKDLGGKAVEAGLDKLEEIGNRGCKNPNPRFVYKRKKGEKHQLIARDGCLYYSRWSGPGSHALETLKEVLSEHNGSIPQALAAINFPSPDVDRASLLHDLSYITSNDDPVKVREADERFIKRLKQSNDPNAIPAIAGISAKILGETKLGLPIYSGSSHVSEEDKQLIEKVIDHLHKIGYGARSEERHNGGCKCDKPLSKAQEQLELDYANRIGTGRKIRKHKRPKNTGNGRASSWIQHVKKYAKDHGISYKEALSKAKASYKK